MAELMTYHCPNCGAELTFDASAQKMKCPYCDSEIDVTSLKKMDDILEKDKEKKTDDQWGRSDDEWAEEESSGMAIYTCQTCGGEIIADQTTGASSCPYCGNPVIMTKQFSGDLKPDYVIPFKLDKEAAKDGLRKHLQGKTLLPKEFKNDNRIDEIKGVYVPFWLFDATANARGHYQATKTRFWEDFDFEYTETRYYEVIRAGTLSFKGIPVDASTKIDSKLMESLEPFDFAEAVDFQTAYLSGYLANRYDISLEESQKKVTQRIKKSAEKALDATVTGYTTVKNQKRQFYISDNQMKYVLYPVWILSTSWQGKNFKFAMNGQTGKFVGDLPVDRKKYWFHFLVTFLITTIIAYMFISSI